MRWWEIAIAAVAAVAGGTPTAGKIGWRRAAFARAVDRASHYRQAEGVIQIGQLRFQGCRGFVGIRLDLEEYP